MRRLLRSLLAAAMVATLAGPGVSPAAAAGDDHCTTGDVQALAQGTIAVAKQFYPRGQTEGAAGAWGRCQFRLYDDNDDLDDPFFGSNVDNPEVPHVFSTRDWIIGGIFQWVADSDFEAYDLKREDALWYLDAIEEHLDWREQGGAWRELALTRTSPRSVNSPLFGEILRTLDQRYHIFRPGSLAPGVYEWRYRVVDPFLGPFEAQGEVHIVGA